MIKRQLVDIDSYINKWYILSIKNQYKNDKSLLP